MKIQMKKSHVAILIFIIGLLIFFYPIVSSYLAEKNQAAVIDHYEENLKNKSDDYFKKEKEKAIDYNNSLIGDPVKDPFVFDSGYALPDNYKQVLNIDGIMGYIEIPKISVKLPIYHGSTEESLSKGVGHIESTSLPIGGESTHSVLTGHRGLPNAKMFTDLNLLNIGDHFYITYLNEIIAYEVDKIDVVKPNDLSNLVIENGMDYISLITCTPYGINTHRLVVRGKRVEYVEEKVYSENASIKERFLSNSYQIIGIIIGFVILVIGFSINKLYEKNKILYKRKEDIKVNNNIEKDVLENKSSFNMEEIEILSFDDEIESDDLTEIINDDFSSFDEKNIEIIDNLDTQSFKRKKEFKNTKNNNNNFKNCNNKPSCEDNKKYKGKKKSINSSKSSNKKQVNNSNSSYKNNKKKKNMKKENR